ncbi:MAG: class I SAM-dependent methyltransferase [Candidatus Bathyarchaeota archaeon]|jgi:ubiquinone/menaquinone biosynthesis C-methylase UbiE|nr:class I SAM-dependent methyltransferase [Candidatus Bathyarchaeota archaeon A05DMB-5]MDH7558542.1 class I SAM-dependent methyltransferase [Candidatus Bathyarchaeota archaeon]
MSEWDKKREIMHRYDVTAHIYDMRYAEEQKAKFQTAFKNLKMERLGLVLDVGCGTGLLFDSVADRAEIVVGVDLSKKTMLKAKEYAKRFLNVHLVLADADKLPFPEDFFNHVFAFTLLQNMPNPPATLKGIVRVAKAKAVVVVTGLKNVFSRESFEELLRDAGLKVAVLESENLKCHVAVCKKMVD